MERRGNSHGGPPRHHHQRKRGGDNVPKRSRSSDGPNLVTYNAIVDVCCKCDDLHRADATLQLMRSDSS